MESDFIEVSIVKWSSYNGRRDVGKPSWFRLEYRLIEDPDFYDFTHEEFKAWIYILSQACRKNSADIRINFAHAHATARLSTKGITGAVGKLQKLQIIQMRERERNADVTDTFATRRDETRRNVTNEYYAQQVERIYLDLYPRKLGKTKGLKRLAKEIGSEDDLASFEKAVRNYAESVRSTEQKFIKHFPTFVSEWRDWIEPPASVVNGFDWVPPEEREVS